MPLYTPNEFKWRDLLPEGDEDKIVKGQHFDVEFTAIAQAFSTVEATLDPNGDGMNAVVEEAPKDGNPYCRKDGGWVISDTSVVEAGLAQEIIDRQNADQALQDQIDALDPDGDRKVDWNEIEGKPTEFPPEAHDQGWDTITGKPADYPPSTHGHAWGEITGTPADFPPSAHGHAWSEITGKPVEFPPEDHGHEIADVNGLQDALNSAGSTPTWDDVTGKPTEFPPAAHNQDWSTITNTPSEYPPEAHTHEQSEVDGLEDRLTQIEGSISSGGGFVDAPNDGQLYGRQSEAWAVVPDGGASSWNDLTDKPATFPPEAHSHEIDDVNGLQDALDAAGGAPAWDDVTGKPSDYPPSAHNHDGVYQPVGDYIGDAPNDGKLYGRQSEAWAEITSTGGGDAIADGNNAGEITTWSGTEWTPDSSLTIDASGSATFSGGSFSPSSAGGWTKGAISTTGAFGGGIALVDGSAGFGMWAQNAGTELVIGHGSTSEALSSDLTIDASGDATFSGNVYSNGVIRSTDSKVVALKTGGGYIAMDTTNPGGMGLFIDVGGATKAALWESGNATFSGTVSANNIKGDGDKAGFLFDGSKRIIPTENGSPSNDKQDLGSVNNKFKDAYFSGTVDAAAVSSTQAGWTAQLKGGNELDFSRDSLNYIRANGGNAAIVFVSGGSETLRLQNNQNATFSGTVDAAGFTVNGVPIGGGASGNFVDKDTTTAQTIKSTLTGPDFIATSDERLKDNITTAPVGLIDSLKGREWDWKESGEKGSGVVAQELEQVLPHLVHTDDEGMKSVSYMGLCAYLIEEVKALRAEVEELKS